MLPNEKLREIDGRFGQSETLFFGEINKILDDLKKHDDDLNGLEHIKAKLDGIENSLTKITGSFSVASSVNNGDQDNVDYFIDKIKTIEDIETLEAKINLIRMLIFETVADNENQYIPFSSLEQ